MIANEKIPFSARITPHMPTYSKSTNHAPRHRQKDPNSGRAPNPPPATARGRAAPRVRSRRGAGKSLSPVVLNGPTSPEDAAHRYRDFLTDHELEEIYSFPDIFYVGNRSSKFTADPEEELNFGFDDETHNSKLIVGDHLAYRFEIISLFGAGAFGQVARCMDHKTKQAVAVKVIVNTDQMHEQGQIEAQVLSRLSSRDQRHIVRAYDYFVFRSHICITFEILGMNLFELSDSNEFRPLPARLVRLYALQMFSALDQCHRIGAIHCDIKPENVLLVPGSNTLIKLIDFGSSCFDGQQKYEYIQSRFYRAPEVLLREKYGPSVDVWSLGCLAAELFLGSPLFPGGDEIEMLRLIQLKLGIIPKAIVKGMGDDSPARHNNGWKLEPSMYSPGNFELFLRERSGMDDFDFLAFINILRLMLQLNPDARITVASALLHPFITGTIDIAQQPLRAIKRRDSMMDESSGSTGTGRRRRLSSLRNRRSSQPPNDDEE